MSPILFLNKSIHLEKYFRCHFSKAHVLEKIICLLNLLTKFPSVSVSTVLECVKMQTISLRRKPQVNFSIS